MRALLAPGADTDPLAVYAVDRPPVPQRPWVFANMVGGLDGSAAHGGRVGALSGPTDRSLFVLLRSFADAVVVGAGTVRAEGYGPVRLPDELTRRRLDEGREAVPPIVVVSRSLRFDWSSRLFSPDVPAQTIVVTAEAAGQEAIAEARAHARVILAGGERVDLPAALGELRAMGVGALLTEGGPTLLGELIHGALLDELCLTISPLVGGDPLPIVVSPPAADALVAFALASVLEEDGHLFLRYLVER
jgi:riboflavin-specific deaminase-like protein